MRPAVPVAIAAALLVAACGNTRGGRVHTDRGNARAVARPADPLVRLGRVSGSTRVEILEVQALADGRVMYCSGVRGLVIVDARNPRAPRPLHSLRSHLGSARSPRCQHLASRGDYVYITNRGDQVQPTPFVAAFRVTGDTPTEVASFASPGVSIEGIDVAGAHVYVAAHDKGVLVLEHKGDSLVQIASLGGMQNAWDVAAAGKVLYVADGKAGLVSVDVSDPSNPSIRGRVRFDGNSQSVVVDAARNTAWVAAGAAGVVALDISDPAKPTVVGRYDSPGSALQVSLSGRYALVADWNDVRVLDIANRQKPVVIATERVDTGHRFSRVLGVSGYKNYVYVGEWTGLYAYELHPQTKAPNLWVETRELDFGRVAAGRRATEGLIVENHGTAVLDVSAIATTGSTEFATKQQRLHLRPGGAALIEVAFQSAGRGEKHAALVLRSNDPDEAAVRVALTANLEGRGVGQMAPEIIGTLLSGEQLAVSSLRGKVVVLAYFASFCPVCGLELPDLESRIWQRYRHLGVVVIGMDPGGLLGGETPGMVRDFIRQTGISFPVAFDHTGSYRRLRDMGGTSLAPFPLDVVIDRSGRIVYISRQYQAKRLHKVIEALLR